MCDDEIKKIIALDHSRQELFKNEMRIRINVLSIQMGAMHTLYDGLHKKVISMDKWQDYMFSLISDMNPHYRPLSDQPSHY